MNYENLLYILVYILYTVTTCTYNAMYICCSVCIYVRTYSTAQYKLEVHESMYFTTPVEYCITRIFGGHFNLAVWQIKMMPINNFICRYLHSEQHAILGI